MGRRYPGAVTAPGIEMKDIMKSIRNIVFRLAVLAPLVFQMVPAPVYGFNIITPNSAWLRAKITYEYDEGLDGLSDKMINFASEKWKKDGDWYYYSDPVESGQKVRFINGVQLPTEWTSEQSDLGFRIVITVEASEVAKGEDGWDENKEASYSETFELWNNGYEHAEDIYVKEGDIKVTVNEYQLDDDGKEVPYENDKVITPGQHVSKIVEFAVSGQKGALIKMKPEKPVKTVMANNIDVNGKTVDPGTVLTYGITVKNPSPEMQRITITDTLDHRLTLLDTLGGTLVSGTIGGYGGTIEWYVDVPGNGSATVNFIARAPETVAEGDGMTIPNTATASIIGQEIDSNTVITSLGEVSPLDQIITIARSTGDASNLALMAGVLAVGIAVLAAVLVYAFRRRKNG